MNVTVYVVRYVGLYGFINGNGNDVILILVNPNFIRAILLWQLKFKQRTKARVEFCTFFILSWCDIVFNFIFVHSNSENSIMLSKIVCTFCGIFLVFLLFTYNFTVIALNSFAYIHTIFTIFDVYILASKSLFQCQSSSRFPFGNGIPLITHSCLSLPGERSWRLLRDPGT